MLGGNRSSILADVAGDHPSEGNRSRRMSPTLSRARARGQRTEEMRASAWTKHWGSNSTLVVLVVLVALAAGFAAGITLGDRDSVTVVVSPSRPQAGSADSSSGVRGGGVVRTKPRRDGTVTATTTTVTESPRRDRPNG